ncbi:MAG: hypothetical protein ACXWV2_12590 [Chitinophagaceae bacterium]
MKPFIILLLIILPAIVQAQDTVKTVKYPQRYRAVKIGTGALIGTNPVVQFGYEKRVNRLALQFGTGFCFPEHYVIDDTIRGNSYAYTLRLEGRKYRLAPATRKNFYMAGELFFTNYKIPTLGRFYDTIKINSYYTDDYLMYKRVLGTALKFGIEQRFLRHFLFDISIGFGIRGTYTKQRGRTDPKDDFASRHPSVASADSELGYGGSIVVPANFSLGYVFD